MKLFPASFVGLRWASSEGLEEERQQSASWYETPCMLESKAMRGDACPYSGLPKWWYLAVLGVLRVKAPHAWLLAV